MNKKRDATRWVGSLHKDASFESPERSWNQRLNCPWKYYYHRVTRVPRFPFRGVSRVGPCRALHWSLHCPSRSKAHACVSLGHMYTEHNWRNQNSQRSQWRQKTWRPSQFCSEEGCMKVGILRNIEVTCLLGPWDIWSIIASDRICNLSTSGAREATFWSVTWHV